jgi:hypothetical protein
MENPPISCQLFLERRISRLQGRLARLQALDRRYSNLRIAVFFAGLAAIALAWAALDPFYARLVLAIAILAFLTVVFLHRRLGNWITRFTIWLDLAREQLARLNQDWEHIPQTGGGGLARGALDIDLDLTGPRSLHHLLDLAVSAEGSQRLASWLTRPDPQVAQITERQQVVQELKGMPRFCQRLLLNLRLVSSEQLRGSRLLEWLQVEIPAARLYWLTLAGSIFTAVNLILFVLNIQGRLPAYWIFSFIIYLAFYYFTAGSLHEFLNAVAEMDPELDKFSALLRYLQRYPLGGQPHLARLCAPFRDPENLPSAQLRNIKLATIGVGLRSNPVMHLLLNLFVPWDYVVAIVARRAQGRAAHFFPAWLETWCQLEALTSLANYAWLHPFYGFPEVAEGVAPVFQTSSLGHPLIPTARSVPNDFSFASLGEVVVLTGSNMSGKSTFLKTVGINLCLAYAGGPVSALSLRCLPFRLHTCMRISDSIADGFSYFYAEVKCLRSLLDELHAPDPRPVLYLIDEIFRGTNNRERLIGSRAYTQSLIGANGAGLIATHDLELAHLADQHAQVRNFHFRDAVQERRLVFDYLLQPGPSPTTNALKIMEMEGLPVK